jgi:hypothetical protein
MFESKERSKRGTAEGFKKLVECVRPKTNYDIVFRWDVAEGGWDARHERYLKQIVHHLRQSIATSAMYICCKQESTYCLWSEINLFHFESQGLHRLSPFHVLEPSSCAFSSASSFRILVSSAEIPLYNFFNCTAKALFPGSSLGRSNNALLALDPSVVFEDKVNIDA